MKFCTKDGSRIIWWKQPRVLGEKPNLEEMKFYGQCESKEDRHFFEKEDKDAGLEVCPVDKTEIEWFNTHCRLKDLNSKSLTIVAP